MNNMQKVTHAEVENVFFQDIREKKRTASGAHHKAPKSGGNVTVHNQSDNITAKERKQLSSELIVFKDSPMNKLEFCKLNEDEQRSYMKFILQKYGVGVPQLSEMLGLSNATVYYRLRKLGLTDYLKVKGKRLGDTEKQVWKTFLRKSETKSENFEEIQVKVENVESEESKSEVESSQKTEFSNFSTVSSISLSGNDKTSLLNDITKVINLMMPDDCKIDVSFNVIRDMK